LKTLWKTMPWRHGPLINELFCSARADQTVVDKRRPLHCPQG
jgi:hypothetical protein